MDISLEALDLTLEYLNNDKMSSLELLGEMVELEGRQFINLTESNDIEVLNEKFSAKELKDKAIKVIKTIIEKIKDFIKWIKDRVVGFFKAVRNKLKSRKSLKQLLSEVKSKVAHESVSFVNEDAASNSAKINEFLESYVGIRKNWNPKLFTDISQLLWKLYVGTSRGIHNFEYYNNLSEILKTEMGIGDDGFIPSYKDDSITTKEFIEQDWQKELEGLCNYLEGTNKEIVNAATSKLKVFEKKLSDLNSYTDEEVLNAGSLKDLLDSHSDDKKSEYENEIKHTTHFISLMTQYTNFANKYVDRCSKVVGDNERFLKNMKKEIQDGNKEIQDGKKVVKLIPAVTPARKFNML